MSQLLTCKHSSCKLPLLNPPHLPMWQYFLPLITVLFMPGFLFSTTAFLSWLQHRLSITFLSNRFIVCICLRLLSFHWHFTLFKYLSFHLWKIKDGNVNYYSIFITLELSQTAEPLFTGSADSSSNLCNKCPPLFLVLQAVSSQGGGGGRELVN